MNVLFNLCLNQDQANLNKLDTVFPQPLKFKLINSISLFDTLLKLFALPRKKVVYQFPRYNLQIISTDKSHLPILYFPALFPCLSIIMVYCHGSGSTLNNVYDFAMTLAIKYNIAVVAYDYSGDGESQAEFKSFEDDIKLLLAWVLRQGYKLNKTIICGFSLGSYSALCLPGQMARILVSPICGIISFFEGEAARYEEEKFDNLSNALMVRCRTLITHCSEQMVHISHGKLLHDALVRGNGSSISQFYEIKDKAFNHKSAPSFLCSEEGQRVMKKFLSSVHQESKVEKYDEITKNLIKQLNGIRFRIIQNQEKLNIMERTDTS